MNKYVLYILVLVLQTQINSSVYAETKIKKISIPWTKNFNLDPVCKKGYETFVKTLSKRVKGKHIHWSKLTLLEDNIQSKATTKRVLSEKYLFNLKRLQKEATKKGLLYLLLFSCYKKTSTYIVFLSAYNVVDPDKVIKTQLYNGLNKKVILKRTYDRNETKKLLELMVEMFVSEIIKKGIIKQNWLKPPPDSDLKITFGLLMKFSNNPIMGGAFARFLLYQFGGSVSVYSSTVSDNIHFGFSTTFDWLFFGRLKSRTLHLMTILGIDYFNQASYSDSTKSINRWFFGGKGGFRLGFLLESMYLSFDTGVLVAYMSENDKSKYVFSPFLTLSIGGSF